MRSVPLGLPLLLLALPAVAQMPAAPPTTLAGGTLSLELRLRAEQVDDDAFAATAQALTMRTRLGWKSPVREGFHAYLEVEDVRALVESYHDTGNGRTRYPVIADPEGGEWNQAYVAYGWGEGSLLRVGRQRLAYDNQRFVGNVGWRQNEQTFDAVSLRHAFGPVLVQAAWLDSVQRVFGNRHPNRRQGQQQLDSWLLNLSGQGRLGSLTGYLYRIDNRDFPATSTQTLGLRHGRSFPLASERSLAYTLEYARQRDWRGGRPDASVPYLSAEMAYSASGLRLAAGYERLGATAGRAFQTPLATGHAFNGWADRFLTTPAAGLADRWLALEGPLGPTRWLLRLHDFRAARGGGDYGREFDAQILWPLGKGWTALAKFAHYQSDGFASDVGKFWLSLEYRL